MPDPKTRFYDTAFPTSEPGDPGLTKREFFAALAMQGMMAHEVHGGLTEDKLAVFSVRQADALIDALNAEDDR